MRIRNKLAAVVAGLVLCAGTVHADEDTSGDHRSITQEDVLGYLEQLVEWQRDATALEPSAGNPRELVFEDALKKSSRHVLQSGLVFAQSEAVIHPDSTDKETGTSHARLRQRVAETDQTIAQLHRQLAQHGLDGGRRQALQDQLKLALAKQELFQNVLSNVNAATSDTTKGFASRINNIGRSIPELGDASKTPTSPTANGGSTTIVTAAAPHPVTSVLSLSADLFDLSRKQRELDDLTQKTMQLETTSRTMLQILRSALDGISGTDATQNTAPTTLTVDQQVAQYKQTGAVLIPLSEATSWIITSKSTLDDWQEALEQRFHTLARELGIHLLILIITLSIPLIASKMARRAIGRYVADGKRQHQLHIARRILAAIAIVFILLCNFISDFSSFATFAGFMTAGLAVALQGVLLSLVAHFFFYGRYGVRKGDRVQVDKVTGEIIQIGMMRFHLRELKANDAGTFEPTGRVVTFPNSILFQPTAFYKYIEV